MSTIRRQGLDRKGTACFPTEIWQNIFALACVDAGQTGCALSLVSKDIRSLSAPVQLQSAILDGPHKLRAFLAALETRPAPYRRVRHLLVTDQKRKLNKPEDWEECFETFAIILRTVALTLQTFFIALESLRCTIEPLMPADTSFPFLVHLTIYGGTPARGALPEYHVPANVAQMPSLRHVHLFSRRHTAQWVHALAGSAPQLVHVHLTSDGVNDDRLAVLLGRPVDANSFIFSRADFTPRNLSSAAQVTIQTYKYIQRGWCGTDAAKHKRMLEALRELENYEGEGARVVLLKERPPNRPYGARESRLHWLDVVEGGSGCWTAPNSDAASDNPTSGLEPAVQEKAQSRRKKGGKRKRKLAE